VNQCPVCRTGELQEDRVETWMRKADQWVLLTGVPATKCDVCGETTFSQKVAERLAEVLAPDAPERPTGSRWSPEYDLEKLNAAQATDGTSRIGAVTSSS
jgi:YgiT-type zinc finger domain-containing protein